MERYKIFQKLRGEGCGAFVPFVVLGDPDYETSLDIIKVLMDSGADMLELGLPFSDPIADGPTIQRASQRALESGITPDRAFELIRRVREQNGEIPIGLLTYYNLVYGRGVEDFCGQVAEAGVDSLLIADLPIEESAPVLSAACEEGLAQIFLAAPTTPGRRLRKIIRNSKAFIYVVSVLGVTGARDELEPRTIETIKRIRGLTGLPLLVGFGISRPEQVWSLLRAGADGVIVGSALIKLIEEHLGCRQRMKSEVERLALALRHACRFRLGWQSAA